VVIFKGTLNYSGAQAGIKMIPGVQINKTVTVLILDL
jgi:hypothetical protein